MEIKDVAELGIAGISLIVVFIMAIIIWRLSKTNNAQGGCSPTPPSRSQLEESVSKAHRRLDDFQQQCQDRHEGLGEKLSQMVSTQSQMATDISWIKKELQKSKQNN